MVLSKSKLNLYARLGSRKHREKLRLFVAEGEKCVADTLGKFCVEALIATEAWAEIHPDFSLQPFVTAGEQELRKISQLQTLPEVIAVYRMPEPQPADERLMSESVTLLLDAVQDPGNLGTILRTASWFGIEQVILGDGCADPYNPKAVQSSMGAVGMVRIIQENLCSLIERHKDIPVYGTLLDGTDIYATPLERPALVVMGNEGNGLSEEIRKRVSHPLLIPSPARGPHAESLNVAAATAITLSEFARRSGGR